MIDRTDVNADLEALTLKVERVFAAPRDLVFKAWSEVDRLAQWWGPTGWTLPVCTVDFRPGGVWHYCMQGPGGEQSWGKAVYSEIVPGHRIVYTDSFSDEAGNSVPGMPVMTTFASPLCRSALLFSSIRVPSRRSESFIALIRQNEKFSRILFM